MGITEEIFRQLKSRLENGVYPSGSRFPSESSLADEFSVNKMTMNKVVSMLAEQKYLIRGIRGAGTRVADLGQRNAGIIAYVGKLEFYHSRVLKGIIAEATRRNYLVLTESPQLDDFQHRIGLLKNCGVSGIIGMGYGLPHLSLDLPVICVDYVQRNQGSLPGRIHFINSDNYQGGFSLMSEILHRGHREILIFSAERFVYSTHTSVPPRVLGFQEAMRSCGISDYEDRTFYGAPQSLKDARLFLKQYLAKYPDTTLIAADSDVSAELIHKAGQELQNPKMEHITLTGFGNITNLPIATVNQNPERQGELAARYLIKFIRSGEPETPIDELVETELVNTGCIPIV